MPVSYTCPRCSYTTSRLSNFRIHLKRAVICKPLHENVTIEDICKRVGVNIDKIYSCESCDKVYASHSGLIYHAKRCASSQTPAAEPTPTAQDTEPSVEGLQQIISSMAEEIHRLRELAAISSNSNSQNTYHNTNDENGQYLHIHIHARGNDVCNDKPNNHRMVVECNIVT